MPRIQRRIRVAWHFQNATCAAECSHATARVGKDICKYAELLHAELTPSFELQ